MEEEARENNKVVYEQQIAAENPERYANLRLTIENLPETETAGLRKAFLQFWEKVEQSITDVIDLSGTPTVEPTPQEIAEFKKNCLYCIGKNDETGDIEIRPMNEENCIKLHGAEWVKKFIRHLQTFIEE